MILLSDEEGRFAVRIARVAISRHLGETSGQDPSLTPVFREKRGVFVTLTKDRQLRGCIGFPYPVLPLGEAIRDAAVAAATGDPRFPPVKRGDLAGIAIEVTVLTVPEPLTVIPESRPSAIIPGKHGLIIRGKGMSGLLLPQVATEYGWDESTFLEHTCMKAGLPAGCWKDPRIEVLTFEGQIFHE